MKVPEFESHEHYFKLNKEDWDLADPNQAPQQGDQVIVESFAMNIDEGGHFKDVNEIFIPHYYRAVFVEKFEDSEYCGLETLMGTSFSPCRIEQIRVVRPEKVWEVQRTIDEL